VSAAAVLAQLTAAGCRVTLRPDGRVSVRPAPAPDLLALARQHRDEIAQLVASATDACTSASSAEAAPPAAEAPPDTRPGVCPGDPPAPIVDPEASRVLTILELAGAEPGLQPAGRLELAHPERASPDLRAAAQHHQADIAAMLTYRTGLEKRWPVTAEPRASKANDRRQG
jgi:hypothetical protein